MTQPAQYELSLSLNFAKNRVGPQKIASFFRDNLLSNDYTAKPQGNTVVLYKGNPKVSAKNTFTTEPHDKDGNLNTDAIKAEIEQIFSKAVQPHWKRKIQDLGTVTAVTLTPRIYNQQMNGVPVKSATVTVEL